MKPTRSVVLCSVCEWAPLALIEEFGEQSVPTIHAAFSGMVILKTRRSAISNSMDFALLIPATILGTAASTVAAFLVAGATMTIASGSADATPAFMQQTGKPCGFCHTKPPELNDQGDKFKANGNKL